MIDRKFAILVEEHPADPVAPVCYGISVSYCLTVSLTNGGAGLWTVWASM
jgi:hypothetical protein